MGGRHNQSRITDADGCKMETSPSTILNTESAHCLGSMPGAILHECPTKVSTGQAPRLGEITYTITKVGLRLRQFDRCTLESEQLGCLGSHLHQPYLADAAYSCRIVPAFDSHHSVDKSRRDAIGFCLVDNGRKIRRSIFQAACPSINVENVRRFNGFKLRRQRKGCKLLINIDFINVEVRMS